MADGDSPSADFHSDRNAGRAAGEILGDPLAHPEIKTMFPQLLRTLVNESDRGALLIAVEHVNHYLRELLEAAFPAAVGRKRRRELLEYPGSFSGFSTRIEAAYVFRLIPQRVYHALRALQKVRNAVAHGLEEFTLAGSADQVHRIYDLGPDLPHGVQLMAMTLMLEYKADVIIGKARELAERDPGLEPIIRTKEEAAEFMRSTPEFLDTIRRQVPLWELVVGVTLLCSSIVDQRDKIRHGLGPDELLTHLLRDRTSDE